MLFVKKVPWVSLSLLLLSYGVFGWLLSATDRSWLLWLMGAIFTLVIAISLIEPLAVIQTFYTAWLKSDARAFISVIIGAFIAVVIIRWLDFFLRLLVLLSAATLARLDLQTAGYGKWQAFGVLVIVSLSGFGLGLFGHQLLHSYNELI